MAPHDSDPSQRYRHVLCEVEEIRVSPADNERYSIVCRAVGLPTSGLASLTWEDIYTAESFEWGDKMSTGQQWLDVWSV